MLTTRACVFVLESIVGVYLPLSFVPIFYNFNFLAIFIVTILTKLGIKCSKLKVLIIFNEGHWGGGDN